MVFHYSSFPDQLDPLPAVQPKQWLSVEISMSSRSEKESMSKTVRGRLAPYIKVRTIGNVSPYW